MHLCTNCVLVTSESGGRTIVKQGKCRYLGPWAMNKKSKDTMLSQTLKVEEKKVSLCFLFEAQAPRDGRDVAVRNKQLN